MTEQNNETFTSKPGFLLKIVAPPNHAMTDEDREVAAYVVKNWIFSEGIWPNIAEQPYEQGPGWMILSYEPEARKRMEAEAQEEFPEDNRNTGRFWDTPAFSGWVLTDGYSDSMTNIWETPLFRTDDPDIPFYTWEY